MREGSGGAISCLPFFVRDIRSWLPVFAVLQCIPVNVTKCVNRKPLCRAVVGYRLKLNTNRNLQGIIVSGDRSKAYIQGGPSGRIVGVELT